MPSVVENVKTAFITEFVAGGLANLTCHSNDDTRNFMYWAFGNDKVIGPGSSYDEQKYEYKVLSGQLFIARLSPEDTGFYRCVSRNVDGGGYKIDSVEMIVKGLPFSPMDAVKLIAIVVSIIVLISCGVIYNRLRKEWSKYDGRAIVPVDDDEEEVEGDEIYNATTMPGPSQPTPGPSTPMPGPSRNQSSEHLLFGIDNQGLDTDFNSVFENIQIKSPQSLI